MNHCYLRNSHKNSLWLFFFIFFLYHTVFIYIYCFCSNSLHKRFENCAKALIIMKIVTTIFSYRFLFHFISLVQVLFSFPFLFINWYFCKLHLIFYISFWLIHIFIDAVVPFTSQSCMVMSFSLQLKLPWFLDYFAFIR